MGIIPPAPKQGRSEHPWWCDRARCRYGMNAPVEHRSVPHVVGPLVLTMTAPVQAPAERWRLEIRFRTSLVGTGEAGAFHASDLTQNVLDAIERADLDAIKRAEVDLSGQDGHNMYTTPRFDFFTMGGDL